MTYHDQRGRGRYGGRPIRPGAPLEGRRLWEVGTWGNASDHIGSRWEELGQEALAQRLKSDRRLWAYEVAPALVALTESDRVQSHFQGLGLTNPDALLVDGADGIAAVRPVDFKWSLETASYRQISGAALAELLAHPESPLPEIIRSARDGTTPADLTPADGFFFAPDSRPNRQFLDSPANRRQEFPLEPKDVVFEVIGGVAFFGPLPWWPQALRLADLDRAARSLETLDGAERYYRLGAGMGGALLKLSTSVFAAEPPSLDIAAATEELIQSHFLRGSLEVIEHLRTLMEQRGERLRRARELWRCPYSFKDLLADLALRGVDVPDAEEVRQPERERWGRVHRAVAEAHRAAVNAAGLGLVEDGQMVVARPLSEPAALAALERRRPDFEARARVHAQRLIRQELEAAPG